MISYAQNFEDVILERIFKAVENGCYVDIGACHPVYDSVTHHFYLRGWRGVNIEPQPDLLKQLRAKRPEDMNLNVCIGAELGTQSLYITSDLGTSTINPVLGKSYRSLGKVVDEIEVSVITINELWRDYIGNKRVDFLKIDIEGLEKDVLEKADFTIVTPRIMVVEAVHPETLKPTEFEWECYLKGHYTFFYFDGLNRFYRRNNFIIDEKFCSTPPNIFDGFTTYKEFVVQEAYEGLLSQRRAGFLNVGALKERIMRCIQWLGIRRK